jgi:hypothetical protein
MPADLKTKNSSFCFFGQFLQYPAFGDYCPSFLNYTYEHRRISKYVTVLITNCQPT